MLAVYVAVRAKVEFALNAVMTDFFVFVFFAEFVDFLVFQELKFSRKCFTFWISSNPGSLSALMKSLTLTSPLQNGQLNSLWPFDIDYFYYCTFPYLNTG